MIDSHLCCAVYERDREDRDRDGDREPVTQKDGAKEKVSHGTTMTVTMVTIDTTTRSDTF